MRRREARRRDDHPTEKTRAVGSGELYAPRTERRVEHCTERSIVPLRTTPRSRRVRRASKCYTGEPTSVPLRIETSVCVELPRRTFGSRQ